MATSSSRVLLSVTAVTAVGGVAEFRIEKVLLAVLGMSLQGGVYADTSRGSAVSLSRAEVAAAGVLTPLLLV